MNPVITALLWTTYFISLYFAVFWLLVFLLRIGQKKAIDHVTEFPLVTITIPAYNEEAKIEKTLVTLLSLEYPKEKMEIFVVDDGSTDGTARVVSCLIPRFPEYTITLLSQPNRGKGAALNHALSLAKGSYFVCLDADSFVEPRALLVMLAHFSSDRVGAVLPSLKVHKPQTLLQKLQWYEYIINMFYKELMGKLDCVHVTPGPFSVYSTSVLRTIGGFDEHNMTEDLEMALRLQKNHYRIIQLLDVTVETMTPTTLPALYRQRNRWFKGATLNAINYRSMLFNRNYGDFGMMQMPTLIFAGLIPLVMLSTILYYSLKPNIVYLYHLSLVHFDIVTLLKSFQFNMILLDLDYVTLFVSFVMLAVSVYVIKRSEVAMQEKFTQHGSLPLIVYLLFYFILLSWIWVGVAIDLLLGRRQKW